LSATTGKAEHTADEQQAGSKSVYHGIILQVGYRSYRMQQRAALR
jgi:hypothetical protein